MKNWKWILGIVVIILVIAVGLFGLGVLHHTQMVASISQSGFIHPPMRGEFHGGMMSPGNGPMMGMRGPGRGGGYFPGGMFFGLFGRLIPLALVLLVLYGVYRLGKSHSAPVAVVAAPAAPAAVVASHPCPACGNAVQDEWKHCPNCGEKQA